MTHSKKQGLESPQNTNSSEGTGNRRHSKQGQGLSSHIITVTQQRTHFECAAQAGRSRTAGRLGDEAFRTAELRVLPALGGFTRAQKTNKQQQQNQAIIGSECTTEASGARVCFAAGLEMHDLE